MARTPNGLLTFAASVAALTWATTPALGAAPQTVTFNTPPAATLFTSTDAEQQYVVPAGVTALHVVAIGAQGGSGTGAGGLGHQVTGDVAVTPGQTVYVEVGGNGKNSGDAAPDHGGFNGGGNGAGGGGGASDLRTLPRATALTTTDSRLIVAAGG